MFKLIIVTVAVLFVIAMAEPEAKAKPTYWGSGLVQPVQPYAYSGYNQGYYPYARGYYGANLGGYYGNGYYGNSYYGNGYGNVYGNGLYGNAYYGHAGIY